MIEARSGYRRNPDLIENEGSGLEIVNKAQMADVGHNVVGAGRLVAFEARVVKSGEEHLAFALVHCPQFRVEGVGQAQSGRTGLLQRMRRADRQKVVYLADG